MKNLFTLSTVALLVASSFASTLSAATIAQWSFNNDTTNPKPPTTGAGTLAVQGGMSFLTALTSDNTGSPGDTTPLSPLGWNHSQGMNGTAAPATVTLPAAASGSVGLKVAASTVGQTNIKFSWHQAQGFRGSRYYQLFATSDGTTFAPVSGGTGSSATNLGNAWYDSITVSNSGLVEVRVKDGKILSVPTNGDAMGYEMSYQFPLGSAYENNPNFAVLLAAVHAPGSSDYVSSFAGTTNLGDATKGYLRNGLTTGGGLRYDLITITPEPASLMAFSAIGLAVLGRSRRSI